MLGFRVQSLMKRIFNQKQLFKVLSLLLCICLIFFYCGIGQAITSYAVAVVDDALLFYLLSAVLASMGICFSSSTISDISDIIVNKIADTYFSDFWQRKKAELQVLIDSGISIGDSIKMNFNDDDWKQAKSSISNYLSDNNYITSSMNNIDTGSYSSLYDYLVAGNTLSIRIDNFDSYYNQFFKLSDNCTLRLCGSAVASTYTFSDRTPDFFNKKLTAIYNVTGTGLRYLSMGCTIPDDSSVINISLSTSGSSAYSLSNKCDVVKSYSLNYQVFNSVNYYYFHTNKCSGSSEAGYLHLTCNGSDVIQDRHIDNLALPATVASDNTYNRVNWLQWLLGADVGATTLPLNVDTKAYNDTWTNSDSVSINVPTTLDRAVSQTTSQARGEASTTTGASASVGLPNGNEFDLFYDGINSKFPVYSFVRDQFSRLAFNTHGFYWEFEYTYPLSKKVETFVISADFYEPYRHKMKICLSVFFYFITLLACWKMLKSIFNISTSSIVSTISE